MEVKFLKVDVEMVRKYGVDIALYYAYLKFVSRRIRKDDHGYFCFDAKYALRVLPFGLTKFKKIRKQAIEVNLVDYIPGNNQNIKPRYRIR